MTNAQQSADPGVETAAPHPEEMKASIDLAVDDSVSIKATARATPAGLIAAALLAAAVLIPLVILARTRRRVRPTD